MNASVLFNSAVGAMLLPPLNLILLCLFGLMVQRRRPRLGLGIALTSLVLLAIFSTQAGARLLLAPLERQAMPLVSAASKETGAGAIVVLSGGRIDQTPEYGGHDIPAYVALMRVRYAARLHRETGVPILLTGGTPEGSAESEAAVMARVLKDDYSISAQWLEGRSNNTAQNAQFSAAILMPIGIQRIFLVTDGIHMPRSMAIFERVGFDVVPAPTALLSRGELRLSDYFPSGEGLRRSHYAMHEWIGLLWYRLRYA